MGSGSGGGGLLLTVRATAVTDEVFGQGDDCAEVVGEGVVGRFDSAGQAGGELDREVPAVEAKEGRWSDFSGCCVWRHLGTLTENLTGTPSRADRRRTRRRLLKGL